MVVFRNGAWELVGKKFIVAQDIYCFDLHLPLFSLSKWPEEKDPKKQTCCSI